MSEFVIWKLRGSNHTYRVQTIFSAANFTCFSLFFFLTLLLVFIQNFALLLLLLLLGRGQTNWVWKFWNLFTSSLWKRCGVLLKIHTGRTNTGISGFLSIIRRMLEKVRKMLEDSGFDYEALSARKSHDRQPWKFINGWRSTVIPATWCMPLHKRKVWRRSLSHWSGRRTFITFQLKWSTNNLCLNHTKKGIQVCEEVEQ